MTREFLETQAFIDHMELFMWLWIGCFVLALIGSAWLIFGFKNEEDE